MPATATASCNRCNGTGQYNGTRRDGSSYTGSCFACQGFRPQRFGYAARRSPAPVAVPAVIPGRLPEGIAPNEALGLARGDAALVAFAAAHPDEYGWLVQSQAVGVAFAMSLLAGIKRYGNLTPRQLAAVQRNAVPALRIIDTQTQAMVDEAEAEVARLNAAALTAITAAPVYPIIEAGPLRAALTAAAASGLRKVRLTLGRIEFKLSGPSFRNGGAGMILCYHEGSYKGFIGTGDRFHKAAGRVVTDETLDAFRVAASDPQAAARAHGDDTGHCACCRRLLTDPVSVMQGIGPVCIQRFNFTLRPGF